MTDPFNPEDFVDSGSGNPLKLGIHGQAQFWNASLALHLAQAWMERREASGLTTKRGDANRNYLSFQPGDGRDISRLGEASVGSDLGFSLSPRFTLVENTSPIPPAVPFPLLPSHLAGLRRTFWPGRSQIIKVHSGKGYSC